MGTEGTGKRGIIIEFTDRVELYGPGMGNIQLRVYRPDGTSFDPLIIGYPLVKKITDKDGNVLWENENYKEKKKPTQ
jgi:hypothetical protein